MKNEIAYFYHLYPEKTIKKKETYFFEYQYKKYILCPYTRSLNEVEALFSLNRALVTQNCFFPKIILNTANQVLTYINGKYYLLKEEILPDKTVHFNEVSYSMNYTFPMDKMASIKRNNWAYLWEKKIDYFEYQREHIYQKFPILVEGLDYFIGMAENAIAYVKELEKITKTKKDALTFTRRRVKINDTLSTFYDPQNFVIDFKVRDIAEFIKSCFFESEISMNELEKWVLNLNLSDYSCGLFLARLLFPSYYFDLYEQIVNGKENETKIEQILEKIDEYQEFLMDLQLEFKRKHQIPMVDWLNKKKKVL